MSDDELDELTVLQEFALDRICYQFEQRYAKDLVRAVMASWIRGLREANTFARLNGVELPPLIAAGFESVEPGVFRWTTRA